MKIDEKSEHVLYSTRRILDTNYQMYNLSKVVSIGEKLSNNEQSMLRHVLNKYEFLFDGTLRTWNTRPVNIEIQPGAKPYHSKPYPVPRAQEAVFRKEV